MHSNNSVECETRADFTYPTKLRTKTEKEKRKFISLPGNYANSVNTLHVSLPMTAIKELKADAEY